MAIRPPQTDSADPTAVTFGIAAVDERLSEADVSFPTTADRLVSELDDPAIPYDAAGNELPLSEALDELSRTDYDSKAELLNLLHPVFERYRDRAAASLFTRIRLLLPF